MRFRGFVAVIMVTFVTVLIGCSHVHSQNYSLQNQWLASNYPNRAAHLEQISTAQPYFRDDVIAGQIQLGMTVDEVLIATDTAPYGPRRYKAKFWCNKKIVQRCDPHCERCEGVIFLKDQLVWFNGHQQPPIVVDMAHQSRRESIFTSAPSEKFRIAEALYRNEIVKGMSFTDVTNVLASVTSEVTYFCDNIRAQSPSICDASCAICKIKIHPHKSNAHAKVIFLQPSLGEHRVTRIEQ
jgi:hypothetical protein